METISALFASLSARTRAAFWKEAIIGDADAGIVVEAFSTDDSFTGLTDECGLYILKMKNVPFRRFGAFLGLCCRGKG